MKRPNCKGNEYDNAFINWNKKKFNYKFCLFISLIFWINSSIFKNFNFNLSFKFVNIKIIMWYILFDVAYELTMQDYLNVLIIYLTLIKF